MNPENQNESQLPVKFEEQQPEELAVVVKDKKRYKTADATVNAFAKFGIKSLRIKTKTLAALGKEAGELGIKNIGHGRVILASENAESCFSKLGAIVEDYLQGNEKPDHEVILELMRLQREFNDQILRTAQVHLHVDRSPLAEPAGTNITMPFPAGAPVMIAVGKPSGAIEEQTK